MSTENLSEPATSAGLDLSMAYATVGVIGHIDHGKTSLVGALTGVETDTHPEEKRRGITIDLGFAALVEKDFTLAFIDAPGHQKYIGNLLAGVSAVEVGLLVVACDQGIQEQTLEHVSVLNTLGVPELVVALSRVDLCDSARHAETKEEIEVFLSEFGFEDFPVVATSTATGEGLDNIKSSLLSAAHRAAKRRNGKRSWQDACPFRMPIDRVMNVPGRGLVVAGTPWTGKVCIGDKLQIAGQPSELRVREIEVHGQEAAIAYSGRRTALNLAGGDAYTPKRGDEIVAAGKFPRCSRLIVRVSPFEHAPEVKCPSHVQLHTATNSLDSRVMGARRLLPATSAVAIVEPESPIVATYGQHCLFRRPYPVGSFAGGKILGLVFEGQMGSSKNLMSLGERLNKVSLKFEENEYEDDVDNLQRFLFCRAVDSLLAWIHFYGELTLEDDWCELQLGVPRDWSSRLIEKVCEDDEVSLVGSLLVSTSLVHRVQQYVVKLLQTQAEESDDVWMIEDAVIKRCEHMASEPITRRAIEGLLKPVMDQANNMSRTEPALVTINGMLAVASEKTQLSKKQRANMAKMLQLFEGNRTPPTTKELATALSMSGDAVHSLLRHAQQQRLLVEYARAEYIDADVLRTLLDELAALFRQQSELTVPQIKDAWQLSRKYAIPLLEYCDQNGYTVRQGDTRISV